MPIQDSSRSPNYLSARDPVGVNNLGPRQTLDRQNQRMGRSTVGRTLTTEIKIRSRLIERCPG